MAAAQRQADTGGGPRPVVAVTRVCPKPVEVPGAEVRVLGEREPTREELLAFVPGAAVIVSMFSDRIDAEVLDAAGPGLRGVCNHAVGYDNVDVDACRERGIVVTNTPDAVTEGTANMAWLLVMATARRLCWGDRFIRRGDWPAHGAFGMAEHLGLELTGRNILIVGAGRIGYATALRSLAFGMRVGYVARSRHVEFELSPLAARRFELDEGLAWADVVSVHTPLTPATRHLIGARRLGLMKEDAIIVSTARGPVIDEAALAETLAAGRIFGAGLDVFEHEPEVHPTLLGLDNVTLSPHVGSGERRFRRVMTELIEQDAAAIIAGEEPANRVA